MLSSTLLFAAATGLATLSQALPAAEAAKKCYYPGWKGIKYMVIFGDSYTTIGFNATTGPQPTPNNPLGNPPYPGYTASNGPNWVDFLTTTYNKTLVQTIDLAYGGATVDSALVEPYLPTVLSVKQQVQDEFLPIYGKKPAVFPWASGNTLFSVFIGINDIGNSYGSGNTTLNGIILKEYAGLVDQLYQSGGRNFLFLNVPPVDRSPLTQAQGSSSQAQEKADIASWNAGVEAIATNLTKTYPDVTTFYFDTNKIFTRVLDNPSVFPQTSVYKNTTSYCVAYENGTPSPYTFDASCGIPVNEYFWLNTLHPTFPMHNVTAQHISEKLSTGPCKPKY